MLNCKVSICLVITAIKFVFSVLYSLSSPLSNKIMFSKNITDVFYLSVIKYLFLRHFITVFLLLLSYLLLITY